MLSTILNIIMPAGLATALVLLYRARADKRHVEAGTSKTDADAAAVISETAVVLLGPLRSELKLAHKELDALRQDLNTVRVELEAYRALHGPLPT